MNAFSMESYEQLESSDTDRSFEYAFDALPCNAMFCDRELVLRYLNRSSRKTLLSLQKYLPVPVDKIVGNSIHIFHKAPETVEKILGGNQHHGAHNLPHKATIALGPVKLDLNVEPMTGANGEYIGAVVVWGVSTQQTIEALREAQEMQRADIEQRRGQGSRPHCLNCDPDQCAGIERQY
jgi:methyl-accepting chemotaxis protein